MGSSYPLPLTRLLAKLLSHVSHLEFTVGRLSVRSSFKDEGSLFLGWCQI